MMNRHLSDRRLRRWGGLLSAGVLWASQGTLLGAASEPLNPGGGVDGLAAAASIRPADNGWMLFCVLLVFLMTGPGIALFYGGLVRRKNVLSTMMHSGVLMGLVPVLWLVFGYSTAFATGNPWLGDPRVHFLLAGVGSTPSPHYAPTVPHQTFMLFQLMLAIVTPALMSGAFAERMKFGAFVVFSVLWISLVYLPVAHLFWGRGGALSWNQGGWVPVLDFAGGAVIHINAGVAALVAVCVIGKRDGFPGDPMPPHNVAMSLTGASLLWLGWFGLEGGSAWGIQGLATSAIAATEFSAASGAVSWGLLELIWRKKATALGIVSGMVAGLATITPAAGFVSLPAATWIGFLGGAGCFFAVTHLKSFLGYDDALDVFGIHGVGGILGMLMVGLAASGEVNPLLPISLAGGAGQLGRQLIGIAVTVLWSGAMTYLILKGVDKWMGLRVDREAEDIGLDLTEHDQNAYNT